MLKEVEHSGAVVNSVPSQQKKKKILLSKLAAWGFSVWSSCSPCV